MNLIDHGIADRIAVLTAGVFRARDLWIRETDVAGGTWQAAQVRREIVTGGGRVICILREDGRGIILGAYPCRKFPGDACNPEITYARAADVRVERLDEHLYRIREQATIRRLNRPDDYEV
ncbi:MAG: hypothetical protein QM578_19060 [Pantoea sp.]|uniref:hypothetical protein n=1 Tax=Pantoea sp. TaxID=69393 RepID=UPI0039E4C5BB